MTVTCQQGKTSGDCKDVLWCIFVGPYGVAAIDGNKKVCECAVQAHMFLRRPYYVWHRVGQKLRSKLLPKKCKHATHTRINNTSILTHVRL
jgi:hypothetical protein